MVLAIRHLCLWGQHLRRIFAADANRITPAPRGIYPSRAAVFSAGGYLSPWVPMLLLLGGDIERNPGPPTYICRICHLIINKRQTSIQCNTKSKHWIHLKCSGIRLREYDQSFHCNLHLDHETSTDNQSSEHDQSTTSTSSTSTENESTDSNATTSPSTRTDSQSTTDSDNHSSPTNSSQSSNSSHNSSSSRQNPPRLKNLKILQININGIRNKITELSHLAKTTKPEIITVQETKLNPRLPTPNTPTTQPLEKTEQPTEEEDY